MSLPAKIARKARRAWVSRLSSETLKQRLSQKSGVTILCYHSIGDALPDYAWCNGPSAFAAHLEVLAELYEILPLHAAMDRLTGTDDGAHPVAVLTFDDGFRDNLEIATPLLEAANVPAQLFVPRDLIQRSGSTHLSTSELKDLAKHPLWDIGSHGITHNVLPGFLPEDQARELRESREWLADLTGAAPNAFAYPQGAICASTVAEARKVYDWGFTTDQRLKTGFDPLQVRRICPTRRQDDPRAFLQMLLDAPYENGTW